MNQISMQTAKGSMSILLSSGIENIIKAIGCTEEDWKLLTGKKVWQGTDRPRVVRVLEGLMHGSIDLLGANRIKLPCEMASAVISVMVNPVNIYMACVWIGSFKRGEDLGDSFKEEPIEGFEEATPQMLYTQCAQIIGSDFISGLSDKFTAKTKLQLGYVDEQQVRK